MCMLAFGIVPCGSNARRDAQKTFDSRNFLKGDFKGYANGVYKIDVLNNAYECIDGEVLEYKVYLKDGEYTIDFNGETYVLQEVANPIDLFGSGIIVFKWKFNSDYYIEDIPKGY